MSFSFECQTFFCEYFVELFLSFFPRLQWSWPWSWTACMVVFAMLASTQTLSWSTPKEQGGSPSLISRATLLLSVLALYSCSMEKSINGWVQRTQCFCVSPSFFICLSPHFLFCSSQTLLAFAPFLWVVQKRGGLVFFRSEKCNTMYKIAY